MQLIEPLMGGVTGAEGGTAEIWTRADTGRSFYHLDFEGTKTVYSGLDIDLDAYGSAEVYVSQSCLVRVRAQNAAVVRTFVILGTADTDELDTPSFTGDTVDEALDTWEPSASAPDFEVLLNAAAVTLSFIGETTFAQMQTLCAVKSFGAVGDGVTDDSVAIGKAIAFASRGGGTVLFNAGTYLITSTIVVPGTVTLRGTGPGGTVIVQSSHTARILSVQSATATAYIRNMTLRYASTSGDFSQFGVDILSGSRVQFNNVSFGTLAIPLINAIAVGSGTGLDTLSEVAVEDCSIYAVRKAYQDFRTSARPSSVPILSRCRIALIGATTTGPYVDSNYIIAQSCAFSGALGGLYTSSVLGTYISPFSSTPGVAVTNQIYGCTFANPASSEAVAMSWLAGTVSGFDLREDMNVGGGNVHFTYANTVPSTTDGQQFRGSLIPRIQRSKTSDPPLSPYSWHNFTGNFVERDLGGAFDDGSFGFPKYRGAVQRAFVHNSSGVSISYTFKTSTQLGNIVDSAAGAVTIPNGQARLWEHISYVGVSAGVTLTRLAFIADAATIGPLT